MCTKTKFSQVSSVYVVKKSAFKLAKTPSALKPLIQMKKRKTGENSGKAIEEENIQYWY